MLFQTWLSEEEILRVKKLAQPLRQRFIVIRGILRKLLSSYSNESPKQIQFAYTQSGKPIFINLSQIKPIEFNLSHSKNRVAFAFTYHTPIGIDIEYKTQREYFDKIAYRFFSADEYEQLNNLPSSEEKLNTFFNYWVRNEARLKAIGSGLETHRSSKYHANKPSSDFINTNEQCSIHSLTLHPDFAAALAICGENKTLSISTL